NEKGEVVFEQHDVEVPSFWSQLATNVVVSKYFRGQLDTPERERSVKQLIGRVAGTITRWGREGGYFRTEKDVEAFGAELTHLLLHQKASFNSPVWFNCGVEPHPQCSACFINSVEDRMESILDLAKTEGMLFKFGSGTGSNLSVIRSSREPLGGGGTASGPVSFMKGYDAFAGVIKSGGKTRRAAKMVILNIDHPDIMDFITCKAEEEKKAWALIEAGYDSSFTGTAYASIFFQNANHSVRVTDQFMRAVEEDGMWECRGVKTGEVMETYRARDLLTKIAEAAHLCGDPGLQFDTTINEWNPCSGTARINASNPCSEYMFLDDTACNLSSLNLMKFRRPDGEFDTEGFRHAAETMILAQEILVGNASYPTPAIDRNSHRFRPLGLGYANLGALLMARGLPYDSDAGRVYAAGITALMCGTAYAMSARIAASLGPFAGFEKNRAPMLQVIEKHLEQAKAIDREQLPAELYESAVDAWDEAYATGTAFGFRNAQATVLAPTGTIAFMMDCDTTGIEPDIALIKYKKLVGGGMFKIVNHTVPLALQKLGYEIPRIQVILEHLEKAETIEAAPGLQPEHLPVFDCAFKPARGTRAIHYRGHILMMAAVQPFLSGAISKTVNMPEESTVEEIVKTYSEAWKLGIKAIAIYRDNCKRSQPLSTSIKEHKVAGFHPDRRRLPSERRAITHKFCLGGHEGYITVGMYDDGMPGEIFVVMAKEGSAVSGLVDSFATAISLALQYGVPLQVLVDKFSHTRFEPNGWTNNPSIPNAKSVMDYIFRWLEKKFLTGENDPGRTEVPVAVAFPARGASEAEEKRILVSQGDAPPCSDCGEIMIRNGACYVCLNCGATSGCS
ncbi:MAG: vitamin B12-dependent ribonucleotide reductase, partial [Acidobacteria bacterium]|nr:vitamin B12-dependent ribonucleotide reductase [Acidobacteriota bacterium]